MEILLKDVLEFDKLRKEYPERRIKLRFNKYKEYDDITYDFVEWYKEDKESKKFKNSLLTVWSNKKKSIEDNDIIFQFIEVEENKWLLVDVAKILSSNNDNGIAESETLKEYEKYFGKLTVDFTNSPNQFYYVEPQIIDNIEIFEITNKPYLEMEKCIK